MTARRFRIEDGERAGVGDRVWTTNHRPWVINGVADTVGTAWVLMEHTEVGHDTLDTAVEGFGDHVHKSHPPEEGCQRAGCRYRPRGARA
jgi:fatty-acid desaturase